MTAIDHPFEALCKLADERVWCWNIQCTTCGHGNFRSGLWELSLGRHPDDPDWVTDREGADGNRCGCIREAFARFPHFRQAALADVVATANLRNIATSCSFPDWLGYLGLALHYTEDDHRGTRLISRSWLPQLEAMREDRPWRRLERDQGDGERMLTWMGLEWWESELAHGPYARPRRG